MISPLKEILIGITDDEDFALQLRDAYLDNVEEFHILSRDALDKGDVGAFKLIVHKIKPTLITLEYKWFLEKIEAISVTYSSENKANYQQTIAKGVMQLSAQLKSF